MFAHYAGRHPQAAPQPPPAAERCRAPRNPPDDAGRLRPFFLHAAESGARDRRAGGPAGLGRRRSADTRPRRRRPQAHLAAAPLASRRRPAATAREYTLTQLGLNYAIKLRGVNGTVGIPFSVRADELVTGAGLRLNYAVLAGARFPGCRTSR